MIDWRLIISLIILGSIGIAAILYPIRKNRLIICGLFPILFSFLFGTYFLFGGWFQWTDHLVKEQKHKKIMELLTKFKDPNEIAEKFRARLTDDKSSAQGWFLLGKVYRSQGRFQEASEALLKAYNLLPENHEYVISYVDSVWENNNRAPLSQYLVRALEDVLKVNPTNPDCLSLLAINAYNSKDYASAIKYWNTLLTLVPEGSEEAMVLNKAILKARSA